MKQSEGSSQLSFLFPRAGEQGKRNIISSNKSPSIISFLIKQGTSSSKSKKKKKIIFNYFF